MTTLLNVRRLEKKYDRIVGKEQKQTIFYNVSEDDRFVDEHDYLLSDVEVKKIEKEIAEFKNQGNGICFVRSPFDPKIKPQ